ncbi:hypothetical protein L9F63_004715, partial [Diploptera punctata]
IWVQTGLLQISHMNMNQISILVLVPLQKNAYARPWKAQQECRLTHLHRVLLIARAYLIVRAHISVLAESVASQNLLVHNNPSQKVGLMSSISPTSRWSNVVCFSYKPVCPLNLRCFNAL